MGSMTLGEMIHRLEQESRQLVLPYGISHPHSYRGYYERLAFEVDRDVPRYVGEWIDLARSCIGQTYQGWKGGEYTMAENSLVYVANEGDCGEPITRLWVDALIELAKVEARHA